MNELHEHRFTCPYCWEAISMVLDLSEPAQTYVEDCEVCCNPIEVTFVVAGDAIAAFEASRMD